MYHGSLPRVLAAMDEYDTFIPRCADIICILCNVRGMLIDIQECLISSGVTSYDMMSSCVVEKHTFLIG